MFGSDSLQLIQFLQDHLGEQVNENILCDKLHTDGDSLSRFVESLREKGYIIEWDGGARTYALRGIPDQLKPKDIQAYLRTSFIGQDVHYFPELPSYTETAYQLAKRYPQPDESMTPLRRAPVEQIKEQPRFAGNGSVIVSEIATQDSALWPARSTGINLYASVVLRPGILPTRAPQIALVAVVALARTLDHFCAARPSLVWPNMLTAGGKTVGKINLKMNNNVEKINFLILGFEVNLNGLAEDLDNLLSEKVTSLRILSGKPINRPHFAATLFKELEKSYVTYINKGPEKVIREVCHYFSIKNKEIHIDFCGTRYTGVIEGFDPEGILLLRSKDGTVHRIPAGNIPLEELSG